MYNYKIGDRVLVKGEEGNLNEIYTITQMPDGSDLFGDHYQGRDERDSAHPFGLFPESDILGLFISETGIDDELVKLQLDTVEDLDRLTSSVSGIQSVTRAPYKGPVVTKNEQVCYFDCDETLVKWNTGGNIIADYYGQQVFLEAYEPHIRFLKAMKARGAYIVVQSGNGWAWAEQVVRLLKLEAFVDEIKTKPYKIVDDSPYENWMPTRIFIEE